MPVEFCNLVRRIERVIQAQLWLLIQNNPPEQEYEDISIEVYKGFQKAIGNQTVGRSVILLESPGGIPANAFRIARLFQRRSRQFVAIVPQYAKSAATLLALGASPLILGRDAELGPLDIQIFDARQERYDSALNSVQSLERLGAYAMTALDQTMLLLMRRIPKTTDVILPLALEYTANLVRPLLEKVDTVEYARKSRDLKVTEEYAARLMRKAYGLAKGKDIARRLIQNYPAHGFVIDSEEAILRESADDAENAFGLGLNAQFAAPNLQNLLDALIPFLDELTVIGQLQEVTP